MLSSKRRLLAAKIEAIYGTDPVPTGADAMQVGDLDVSPAEAQTVERNLTRPYYGQAERLMASIYAKATFTVELAGHSAGVIGTKPKIDALIRACGFAATQGTKVITSLVSAAGVATATIGPHNYKVGEKIPVSGAEEEEYNGVQTITAVGANTFSYAVAGGPDSPATGAPVILDSYIYKPISKDIPSLTFYYNKDGVLHKMTGSKGTFSLDLSVKNIPKLKFEFTGLNSPAGDVAPFVADFSAFTIPQVANTQNTTNFSLLGYEGALESLGFDLNNQVEYVTLIGKEYVDVLDRKVSGNMSFEEPTIAEKDFWAAVKAQQTGALTLIHGSQNGNKVSFEFPRVLLDSPKNKEMNNVMMLTAGVSILPVDGDDEMTIEFQ